MRSKGYHTINQFEKENRISLLHYIDSKFEERDKASVLAVITLDKRLNSMNEFRNTLKDQAASFITRQELNLIFERLEKDIRELQNTRVHLMTISAYEIAHKDLVKQVDDLRISEVRIEAKASQNSVNHLATRTQLGLLISFLAVLVSMINFLSQIFGLK